MAPETLQLSSCSSFGIITGLWGLAGGFFQSWGSWQVSATIFASHNGGCWCSTVRFCCLSMSSPVRNQAITSCWGQQPRLCLPNLTEPCRCKAFSAQVPDSLHSSSACSASLPAQVEIGVEEIGMQCQHIPTTCPKRRLLIAQKTCLNEGKP